jgi:hypothetical protein
MSRENRRMRKSESVPFQAYSSYVPWRRATLYTTQPQALCIEVSQKVQLVKCLPDLQLQHP